MTSVILGNLVRDITWMNANDMQMLTCPMHLCKWTVALAQVIPRYTQMPSQTDQLIKCHQFPSHFNFRLDLRLKSENQKKVQNLYFYVWHLHKWHISVLSQVIFRSGIFFMKQSLASYFLRDFPLDVFLYTITHSQFPLNI